MFLPEVCHYCRKLKSRAAGRFQRIPGRCHFKFVCDACRAKLQERPGLRHRRRRPSYLERIAIRVLTQTGYRFDQEYPIEGFFFDFAIPALRLLIEVDGRTWHRQPSRKRRDRVKTEAAKKRGWAIGRASPPDIEGKIVVMIDYREEQLIRNN